MYSTSDTTITTSTDRDSLAQSDLVRDARGANPLAPDGAMPGSHNSPNQQSDRRAVYSSTKATLVFSLLVVAALVTGWLLREESYLTAEDGLGYILGIVGGSMMLLLLLYPLRKNVRWMRVLGSVKFWFRAHMVLGVVGPLLVLYHANFQLGSLNSKVATISMIAVAISGLIGRYFYTKIHHGLYGHRTTMVELMEDAVAARQEHTGSRFLPNLDKHLLTIEQTVLQPPNKAWTGALRPIAIAVRTRWAQIRLTRFAARELKNLAHDSPVIAEHRDRLKALSQRHVANRLRKVRRVAEFTFYERLFAVWHVLHYPLFIVMIVAATVHILAVHMY